MRRKKSLKISKAESQNISLIFNFSHNEDEEFHFSTGARDTS